MVEGVWQELNEGAVFAILERVKRVYVFTFDYKSVWEATFSCLPAETPPATGSLFNRAFKNSC